MDGFACSSWYFLRFASPRNEKEPFDAEAVSRWLPVDTYVGGAEHAVMHLLYARFWTKVIFDAGLLSFSEPFAQLRNQGVLHSAVDGQRMSKSKGNVVTPDEIVAVHGTDALRAYVLFLGPFDADVVWDDRGIKGVTRFLDRYWKLANETHGNSGKNDEDEALARAFERKRHQIIQRITADMEAFRFNTAIAALMEYLNYLVAFDGKRVSSSRWRTALETLTLLMSPFVPFITEEVWQNLLSHVNSVHQQPWPQFDESKAKDEQITIVIQVNGKMRDKLLVPAETDQETLQGLAIAAPRIQRYLDGKTVRNIIVVPQRLVNIVI